MSTTSFIASASAVLAGTMVALEANSMGVRKAEENTKREGAKDTIRDYTGTMKLNYPSVMHNETKKEIFRLKTPLFIKDVIHGTAGYFKGFFRGIMNNLLTTALAIGTIALPKEMKRTKAAGAIALGASVIWNFLKNGTNLFEKKNDII